MKSWLRFTENQTRLPLLWEGWKQVDSLDFQGTILHGKNDAELQSQVAQEKWIKARVFT